MTQVRINSLLQEHTDLPPVIEASGTTIGECLDDLTRQFPRIRTWLFDPDSLVRVIISINNVEMVTLDHQGLSRALASDDQIMIFAVASGG